MKNEMKFYERSTANQRYHLSVGHNRNGATTIIIDRLRFSESRRTVVDLLLILSIILRRA